MTNLISKIASAVTALALIAAYIPVAFAQEVIENIAAPEITSGLETIPTEEPAVETEVPAETPAVETEVPAETPIVEAGTEEVSAPMSLLAEPLATNDGDEFDSFNNGSINGQGGWMVTGPYDQAIVDNLTGPASFGLKAFRLSNAVTSGGFGDQVFSPLLADAVGENETSNHFETSFDFISAIPNFEQPGLAVTVSPDRGDGSRMSYLKLADTPAGIEVTFYDVQGTGNPANFVPTVIASALDRTAVHNIRLTLDTVDGPSNDVVNVYIDGTLVHTGTSWENYYRYDSEASAEQAPRAVRTVLFRVSGTAAPATSGNGFLFDHFDAEEEAVAVTPAPETTTVVRAADLDTARTVGSDKWFFHNDQTDTVDNTLGSFVFGPEDAPAGDGSAQISTVSATQGIVLGTMGKIGTRLDEIAQLQYSTYRSVGDPALAMSLGFDFDNDTTAADGVYLGRLVYEPYHTQTVATGDWQTWDTLNDAAGTGTGNWWFSRAANVSALAAAPNLANCPQSNPCTWAQVKAAFPQGGIRGMLGFKAGSGWATPYTGNVDNFVFGTYDEVETVDFEPVANAEQTLVVTAESAQGWVATGAETGASSAFVEDADAPLGDGALQLTTTDDVNSVIRFTKSMETRLADLVRFAYSTQQVAAADATNGNATMRISIDLDGVGSDTDDQLMFEPYYNGFSGSTDWETWTITQNGGKLWSNFENSYNGKGGVGAGSYASNFTVADVLNDYPNAKIVAVTVSMGTWNVSQQVLVDDVEIKSATENTVYDFEPTAVSGGNGGGGGGRSGGSRNTNNDGEVAGASTGGEVLGASTYNFMVDLTIGSTGADVTALQQFLIDAGFLSIPAPTGYFGEMTRAAVAKWQASRGITPAAGYFGPISRAAIGTEGTPAPAMTAEQRATLIKELLEKVKELQEKLDAMDA